jgi:hypothetical protein
LQTEKIIFTLYHVKKNNNKKILKHITESRSFKHFWRPFFTKPIPEAQKHTKKKRKKKGKDLSLSGWCRLYRTYVHLARNNSITQLNFK